MRPGWLPRRWNPDRQGSFTLASSATGWERGPVTELQDAEEVDEVLFLIVREPNLEAAIEEVHQFGQIPGGTVGEVGRAGGESAELLHQDGAAIRAFSGDECTAGVLS